MNPLALIAIGITIGIPLGLGIAWLIGWADQFYQEPLDFDDSVIRMSSHRRVP